MKKTKEKAMSKYIEAIKSIGEPCSPKQIRNKVNTSSLNESKITAQNCASALNNLLIRGQIIRGKNGLYMTPEIKDNNQKIEEPI